METLDLDNYRRPGGLATVLSHLGCKTKKEISWSSFMGSSNLKDIYSKISSVYFLKQIGWIKWMLLQTLVLFWQSKNYGLKHIAFCFSKLSLSYMHWMCDKISFKGYTWINR